MQNKNYRNFTDEKTDDDIAVGVPINMNAGQNAPAYFQQPLNPYMAQQPQAHYPNYNAPFHQMGQQPAMGMAQPQPMAPQQQQPLNYSQPITIRCPCCSSHVTTVVNNEPGNAAYLWAGLLCCCVSPLCACLPFLTDKCMDKNHYCPSCGFNIVRKHKGFVEC